MRTRNIDKEQLVKQKAIESIVKYGFEGFSMNKLAKACGISVATLYIYYKDRDDLILSIALEEGDKMGDAMIKSLDPESSFEEGLRVQWKNRYKYMIENPLLGNFFDQIRSSSYQVQFADIFLKKFKSIVGRFMENVVARGEIDEMPFEVYWSIAFSPLYALIKFHMEGTSVGGKPFTMTDEILWKTFDLVVKALKN
ncbi:TetR/AcrR family transcriptional regulator [Mucilaginibacter boryungensis]|uniref:TetR/AcrR family transcriptional regulator n=1 Tax=Mucilaginibacter boryungensis TaxID=768480 RepID=A0ABR9XG30_9SPHI|nr:TetR/AcrR family transcriptional regulator [Mucilaginibacter boryungensis]MBE9666342.1 TetR/AcrR family transcriptional regulator [Mucilaginibacter boryungensis]